MVCPLLLPEFLSLYALTRSDTIVGNGTWDDLPVKNGEAVRAALFGSGLLAGDLISQVHIGGNVAAGQNPYKNINEILKRLGIDATPVQDHQTHFHIYLNPPTPVEIDHTANLLVDALSVSLAVSSTSVAPLQANAQGLLDYAQTITNTGEEIMFTMDVPYVPVQDTPIVLAQAAVSGAGSPAPGSNVTQPDYLLKACKEVPTADGTMTALNVVDPAGWLAANLGNRDHRYIDPATEATIKIIMLESTTHGKLNPYTSGSGGMYYGYESDPGYLGKDNAVFMAEFEGRRYKIVINLVVSTVVGESPLTSAETPVCPPPHLIKVNGKPVSGSSSYDLNSIPVTFADLTGSALGQTSASGITLDTNAAGYNWFIDTTPADNSEFLPTSNPNEWVAKAGSAADGKMDMLSVLLHEYGHALGINHSADPNDFMGTTLTAGVRRLPTADEMALMQNLIAQAKGSLTPTLSQGERGQNAPAFPTLPLGTSFIGFLGLLRGSRYGGVSIAPDASTLVTQYDWAANATLTNGSLNAADGWSTQGSVNIGNGAATMNEVSGSQTRLSQVFLLNPSDRFLSFTLAGTALDNLTGAPHDAFEVALLDANTGASLLGSDGLTRSDAFLNLQADGTQNLANCVTCINNADGSRTYRVDLAGVPAGTAANLQ